MLGLAGGASGSGFSGPQQANLLNGVTVGDTQNANIYAGNTQQAQQNLLGALQGQNGLGNQNQVYNQLQGVENGTGPNAAQAQYQQNVQDLAKQQAGAIASQKGISPALQAQLISQQGSGAMQNAAAAGATNQAQQQLAALNSMGNLAGVQAGNQIAQTNANAATAQGQQGILQQAAANFNSALTGGQSSVNSANAGLAQQQMQAQQKITGGIGQSAGSAAGMSGGGGGGGAAAAAAANGGSVDDLPVMQQKPSGPMSHIGQMLSGSGGGAAAAGMAQGGEVNVMLSPGELELSPQAVKMVSNGANPMKVGGVVPGKPKVPGNSYKNDVVPKDVKPKSIIIPNSVMQSKDPSRGAAEFVQAVLAKRRSKG